MIHGASDARRPCYGRPMIISRFVLLSLVCCLVLPLTSGCDSQIVGTSGFRLSDMFPSQDEWFWRYNNDGWVEEVWWQGRGITSPDGEAWTTLRVWMDDNASIIDDFAGSESGWSLELFFADRADGWYLMGYSANSEGASAELGSAYLEGDGVPLLMNNVLSGDSWVTEQEGGQWTTTVTRFDEELAFNSQLISESWRIDLVSESGTWPFEGSYWFVQGPGVVQFDVPFWRPESGHTWQHLHNDSWSNRLGVSDR